MRHLIRFEAGFAPSSSPLQSGRTARTVGFIDTQKKNRPLAVLFLRIYRIMTPAFSQAVKVPSSHRLACTSPMWQVPIISIHRRL